MTVSGTERLPNTGPLERRALNAMARDVATIRWWVGVIGVFVALASLTAIAAGVTAVGLAAGWWHLL